MTWAEATSAAGAAGGAGGGAGGTGGGLSMTTVSVVGGAVAGGTVVAAQVVGGGDEFTHFSGSFSVRLPSSTRPSSVAPGQRAAR